jgi:hypothetical protein
MDAEPSLADRLKAIAAFLPAFEDADFVFARRRTGEPNARGIAQLPWYGYSPTAQAFVATAYEYGWVCRADYATWMETRGAKRLRDEPAALAAATPDQLASLLTVLIRHDRFVEGELAGAFRSGLLTGIVRRAAAVCEELGAESPGTPT